MPLHLKMLNNLRTQMVRKRYPAKLINILSRVYLQGLQDEEEANRKKHRTRRKRARALAMEGDHAI